MVARMMTLLITALFVLPIDGVPAQSQQYATDRVVARLSYNFNYEWSGEGACPTICFELYGSGRRYRISRMIREGRIENLEGILSRGQLKILSRLLTKLHPEEADGVGVIRQGSESMMAEIVRGNQTLHYLWIDPDHQRPFPDEARNIIKWLQSFKATGASPISQHELSIEPICPRSPVHRVPEAFSVIKIPNVQDRLSRDDDKVPLQNTLAGDLLPLT